jgi:hypothetical protein
MIPIDPRGRGVSKKTKIAITPAVSAASAVRSIKREKPTGSFQTAKILSRLVPKFRLLGV